MEPNVHEEFFAKIAHFTLECAAKPFFATIETNTASIGAGVEEEAGSAEKRYKKNPDEQWQTETSPISSSPRGGA